MRYLGIDGGQSHIEAVLYENGKVIARGNGGPSHIQGQSMEQVFSRSLDQALNHFPPMTDIAAIGVGVSGRGIPGKLEAIEVSIHYRFPNARVFIENDAVVGHWGAALGKDGASILAGTGTIAYGAFNGRTCRLGGFGYLFGDEGGGVWIGLQAIRRALRSVEGRVEATSLVDVLPPYFKVKSIKNIPGVIYAGKTVNVKQIAGLAKLVIREALQGDSIAEEIVNEAGVYLGETAIHLLTQLKIPVKEHFPIYRLGGILRSDSMIRHSCEQLVSKHYPRAVWQEPLESPAVGAALMAQAKLKQRQSF